MDKHLAELIKQDTPPLNPLIANGLAVDHMKNVEAYVDAVFRSVSKDFPEGLTYVNCSRCTDAEEFAEITKKKGTKRTFDVAVSYIYMMKYHFRFKGEDLPPRYINLPFVGDAGYLVLGGSLFNISPTLADRVISVGVSSIFIRLLRDRLTIERMQQHYMADGKRESVQVAWSLIYHKNAKMRKIKATIRANTSLFHYLLCKYGFAETFARFGKCAPIVGGAEINKNTYPENEWVIITSSQVKPKGCGRSFWTASNLRMAIRRLDFEKPIVKNMIGGFFYIVDHFPQRVLPAYIGTANEKRLWMVLMGHILFSGNIDEGKLHDDVQDHINSMDEYLDSIVAVKLQDIDIFVENIYQLFGVVIENYNTWLLGATDKISSMADKELSTLYYVLYDITSAIFKMYFKLKAASKKELTAKEVIATMNLTLRSGMIFSLTRMHPEVSTVVCPGDNKAFKVTSLLVPQTASNRMSTRKDPQQIDDPSKRLHVTVAEFGNYSNLPKSAPDGRSRINQHAMLDDKGKVVRNPKFIALMDSVQKMIQRN
jgi:hypothetical protein